MKSITPLCLIPNRKIQQKITFSLQHSRISYNNVPWPSDSKCPRCSASTTGTPETSSRSAIARGHCTAILFRGDIRSRGSRDETCLSLGTAKAIVFVWDTTAFQVNHCPLVFCKFKFIVVHFVVSERFGTVVSRRFNGWGGRVPPM